jgi:hypothetical protein
MNWNAEPNAPYPSIKINGSNLLLSFYMNHLLFNNFSQDDIGIIEFYNCIQFRMGEPNDEGFFRFGDGYKQYGIEWGEFYRISGSEWKTHFESPVYIHANPHPEELSHYLFYFKDETFECIAIGFDFRISKERP